MAIRKFTNRKFTNLQTVSITLSFQSVTMEWWERQSGNLAEKHAREIRPSMENHVLPQIGHLQITDITPKAIKDVLLGV